MSGCHKWSDLRERFLNDPEHGEERRREVEKLDSAYDALLALHELRQATGTTQAEAARGLGVSQPHVAKLERQGEMSLTTLASYLAVLGGHLEVRAVFPEHPEDNVTLSLPSVAHQSVTAEVDMEIQGVVSRDPEVMNGALVFAGTRVPVEVLVEYLAAGDSLEAFLEAIPTVSREQAVAYLRLTPGAVEEAGDRIRRRSRHGGH